MNYFNRHINRNKYDQIRKRFFGSAFLVLVLLVSSCELRAQTPVDGTETPSKSPLNEGPVRWLIIEKSVGVVPEIDFVNGTMGIGLCRGKFLRGTQRSIAGNGYFLNAGYDTDHKITVASFGGWIGYFKRKFGGQVGMRAAYYVKKDVQAFAIRPEAGIGFVKAQLSYGYNIFFEKQPMELATHTLTLSVYFAVHADKVRMY